MSESKNYHGLVSEISYGPVPSRRFGRTLGINLLPPNRKLCSFNCVYCQLGWSDQKDDLAAAVYPSVENVMFAARKKCMLPEWGGSAGPSYIVISGNGEPTLHPEFGKIAKDLLLLRDECCPKSKVICFTNGSRLDQKSVLEGLLMLDECHLKLDSGFERVDLPVEAGRFQSMLEIAKKLPNLVLQSCFFTGRLSNIGNHDVKMWLDAVLQLNPKRLDVYTVSRKTAVSGLLPVSHAQLLDYKEQLRSRGFDSVRII